MAPNLDRLHEEHCFKNAKLDTERGPPIPIETECQWAEQHEYVLFHNEKHGS